MAQQGGPEAPRLSHPCLPHLIGLRFPKFSCEADHCDAAATTCLYLDGTRPTVYGHGAKCLILMVSSHASSTLTERAKVPGPLLSTCGMSSSAGGILLRGVLRLSHSGPET
ncbi:hypothetical protein PMIN02_011242 [Paraphaeosphaeria minitans]